MVYNILMINLKINENDSGRRLDRFLRKYFRNAPLSYIYKLIRTEIRVNDKKPSQSQILKTGDLISIGISKEEAVAYLDKRPPASLGLSSFAWKNQALKDLDIPDFKVIYEDDNIIVADKPAGLLTHESKEEKVLTLSNQILSYLIKKDDYRPSLEKIFKPGPANRLDRNTSGLVCFGKNAEASRGLAKMFRERGSLDRYYLALVCGKMEGSLVLTGLAEKAGKDQYMETHVKVLETIENKGGEFHTLVEAMLVTGRTHQIRKQLAAKGHPIVGDVKYGGKRAAAKVDGKTERYKLYLHGWKMLFNVCPEVLSNLEGREIISPPPWDRRRK